LNQQIEVTPRIGKADVQEEAAIAASQSAPERRRRDRRCQALHTAALTVSTLKAMRCDDA
jgi:hypothetical protein